MTRLSNLGVCILATIATGHTYAEEGSRTFEFELSKTEIIALNLVVAQVMPGDSAQAISERLSKTRQPIGFGAKEDKTYDKADTNKIVAHAIIVYVKKKRIGSSTGGNKTVCFWFRNGSLTEITTNSPEIQVKRELLNQSNTAIEAPQ